MTTVPINHDDAVVLLDAYLDGELDVAGAMAFERHSEACADCRARLEDRRRLSSTLRSAPLRFSLPSELEASISRSTQPPPLRSPSVTPVAARRPLLARWPNALAAGFLLAVSGYFVGQSVQRPLELGDVLVDAHVRSVLSGHSIDVISSDHHTVKPWLSARVPFSPPVPEMKETGDALLGGRVDYVNHRQVAALVYQHGKHPVNVFVWPTSAIPRISAGHRSSDGYHLLTTQAGDFTAAFVSDMSIDELERFREQWREAAVR